MRNITTIRRELRQVQKHSHKGKLDSIRDIEEARAIEQTLLWVLGDESVYSPSTWAEIRKLAHTNMRRAPA